MTTTIVELIFKNPKVCKWLSVIAFPVIGVANAFIAKLHVYEFSWIDVMSMLMLGAR